MTSVVPKNVGPTSAKQDGWGFLLKGTTGGPRWVWTPALPGILGPQDRHAKHNPTLPTLFLNHRSKSAWANWLGCREWKTDCIGLLVKGTSCLMACLAGLNHLRNCRKISIYTSSQTSRPQHRGSDEVQELPLCWKHVHCITAYLKISYKLFSASSNLKGFENCIYILLITAVLVFI